MNQLSQQTEQSRTNVSSTSTNLLGESQNHEEESDITSFLTTLQPSHLNVATADEPMTYLSNVDSHAHSIVSFLNRPQHLGAIAWNSSADPGTILREISYSDMFTPVTKEKLNRMLFFRGNPVLRLQVNVPPTAAGLLGLSWLPDSLGSQLVKVKNADLSGPGKVAMLSSMTRILLNLNSEQEVSLKVPFVIPENFASPVNDSRLGTFLIWVYSKLDLPDLDSISIIPWIHWEDVVVQGPTAQTLSFTQQGGRNLFNEGNLTVIDEDEPPISKNDNGDFSKVTLDSITAPMDAPKSEPSMFSKMFGINEISNGPISGISKVAANVAFAISAAFPSLSVIGLPIAGISTGISRLAKLMGFGRKLNRFKSHPMFLRNFEGFANTDGLDDSHPLSVFVNSDLPIQNVFGLDIDELNLNYIASHPGFLDRFVYSTSSAPSTLLFSRSMYPGGYQQSVATGNPRNGNYDIFAPIAYVSSAFKYFRGDQILTMHFVKTRFHAGRLCVCFEPSGATTATMDDCNSLYRIIIDLKDTNMINIRIPWLTNNEWKTSIRVEPITWPSIHIFALDTLISGGGASTSIDIVLEVSASENFQWAYPHAIDFYPDKLNESPFPAGDLDGPYGEKGTDSVNTSNLVQQIGSTSEFIQRKLDLIEFFPSQVKGYLHPNETLISARSLIQRYMPFVLSNNLPIIPQCAPSYLSIFSGPFAFWRGSIRVKIISTNQSLPVNSFVALAGGNAVAAAEQIGLKGSCTVTLPYYNINPRNPNSFSVSKGDDTLSTLDLYTNVPLDDNTKFSLYIAAGDDFQCGAWSGIPPMYSNRKYSNANPDSNYGPPGFLPNVVRLS